MFQSIFVRVVALKGSTKWTLIIYKQTKNENAVLEGNYS